MAAITEKIRDPNLLVKSLAPSRNTIAIRVLADAVNDKDMTIGLAPDQEVNPYWKAGAHLAGDSKT